MSPYEFVLVEFTISVQCLQPKRKVKGDTPKSTIKYQIIDIHTMLHARWHQLWVIEKQYCILQLESEPHSEGASATGAAGAQGTHA